MPLAELRQPKLSIRLFGRIVVEVDGAPIRPLISRRGLDLIALLALRANREVAREWLAGTLWPESGQTQSLANLRRVLTDLRAALGAASSRLSSPGARTLKLVLLPDELDVETFDRCMASGEAILSELERAIALYSGPLLEGCYDVWAVEEQVSRRESYLSLLETAAEATRAAGRPTEAVRYLRLVLAAEPWRECAAAQLMEALAANGDSAAAGEVFRALRSHVTREMHCEPSSSLRELYLKLRTQPAETRAGSRGSGRAPGPKADSPLSSLPTPLTPLIGRQAELAEIARALSAHRLVTITGPGGMGKSRVSIQAACDHVDSRPGGVWFIELAPITSPNEIAATAASVLGLREGAAGSVMDALIARLKTSSALLVLDNCEHVIQGSAEFASAALGACPNLRILATSRQPLGVSGEIVQQLSPLPHPELEKQPDSAAYSDVEELARKYEAIELFVERANSVRQGSTSAPGAARALVKICKELDGIPLAIELAAARVGSLSVDQIATRLDNRFTLLTGGCRSAMPRQRTLRALIDWSYDFLTAKEQLLFCRLSAFVGGFTLASAEEVCSGASEGRAPSTADGIGAADTIEEWEVVDLLAELVNKSLVQVQPGPAGEHRFGMLETIRQYSLEKLQASGESSSVKRRHCHSFLKFAVTMSDRLSGELQRETLLLLDADHDNLRSALTWAAAGDEPAETAMRICGALSNFWLFRGHYREGSLWCRSALERRTEAEDQSALAGLLSSTGTQAMMLGNLLEAYQFHGEALAIHRGRDDKRGIAVALERQGMLAHRLGRMSEALPLLRESVQLCREIELHKSLTVALMNLGCLLNDLSLDGAQPLFEEGLELARCAKNDVYVAVALANLALLAASRGEYASAQKLNNEALALMQSTGDRGGIAVLLLNMGEVSTKLGDFENGFRLIKEALVAWRDLGNRELMLMGIETFAAALAAHSGLSPERSEENRRLAARLHGAAEVGRELIQSPMPGSNMRDYEPVVAALASALGEEEYARLLADGRQLPIDSALSAALNYSA